MPPEQLTIHLSVGMRPSEPLVGSTNTGVRGWAERCKPTRSRAKGAGDRDEGPPSPSLLRGFSPDLTAGHILESVDAQL